MAKTEETKQAELDIWKSTAKQGVFGCFEVTIGWLGKERVDYMTYDTKGLWRCYEIKISKTDFHSKAANTFIGNYNYYCLTKQLYEEIKEEIPSHIGVYIGCDCIKKAKKQKLKIDEQVLKDSLIRSLYREVNKQIQSGNPTLIEFYKREKAEAERNTRYWYDSYKSILKTVIDRYGYDWDKKDNIS